MTKKLARGFESWGKRKPKFKTSSKIKRALKKRIIVRLYKGKGNILAQHKGGEN